MAEQTLAWTEFNPANALPSGVETLFSDIEAALSSIVAILDGIKAVFEVFKLLVFDAVDPLKTILSAIRVSTEAILESLEEAGIYALFHVPQSLGTAVTPRTWLSQVATSMVDPGDVNRPEFTNPTEMGGVIIMLVAPDVNAITSGAKDLISALFKPMQVRTDQIPLKLNPDDPPPKFVLDRDALAEAYGTNINRGQGVAPDWQAPVLLKDLVPPMASLSKVLKQLLGVLVYGEGASVLIQNYIDFIDAKIDLLNSLQTEFQAILDTFAGLVNITANIYTVGFAGSFTTDELISSIVNSPLPESVEAENNDLVAGGAMLFLAGGGISPTVALLQGLTGASA